MMMVNIAFWVVMVGGIGLALCQIALCYLENKRKSCDEMRRWHALLWEWVHENKSGLGVIAAVHYLNMIDINRWVRFGFLWRSCSRGVIETQEKISIL